MFTSVCHLFPGWPTAGVSHLCRRNSRTSEHWYQCPESDSYPVSAQRNVAENTGVAAGFKLLSAVVLSSETPEFRQPRIEAHPPSGPTLAFTPRKSTDHALCRAGFWRLGVDAPAGKAVSPRSSLGKRIVAAVSEWQVHGS